MKKKIILGVLYGLAFWVAVIIIGYEILIEQNYGVEFLIKAIGTLVSIMATFLATVVGKQVSQNKKIANKKSFYKEQYSQYIGDAFSEEPKMEKQLYKAIDAYAQGQYSRALTAFQKLQKQSHRGEEYYTATTFMGFCYHGMKLYKQAIEQYQISLQRHLNSNVANSMGFCCESIGNYTQAEKSYLWAISADRENAVPYNNLAVMLIRLGDFETALGWAEHAVELNQKFPQALNSLAICHYVLGNQSEYEHYYRQAVACGSNGQKLKAYIESLDPTI